MNNQDAKFVARVFNEILGEDASTFRLPKRKAVTFTDDDGEEVTSEDTATRYGVVLDQSGQMFGSVLAAKQYINEG